MTAALWCKSNGSFLEGASHPEELVDQAIEFGLRHLAITDRDGVYGSVRAHMAARSTDLHLIHGAQVTLDDQSSILLLVRDQTGWANLCSLLTKGRLRCPKGQSRVSWDEVCLHAGGLFALWGGRESLLVGEADPWFVYRKLRHAFGERLYALVSRHREADEVQEERRLRERAKKWQLATVAAVEVLYHHSTRRQLQDVLTCIRHSTTLNAAGRLTRSNAHHALLGPGRMQQLFSDDPESLIRAEDLAKQCRFGLDQIRYRYPAEALPDGTTAAEHLRQLSILGAHERYGERIPPEVRTQIDRELALIAELEYDGYFLTMYEIVQFCRREKILCQGRGSAANSAVCYCLGITAVDPVRMGLLFERFLSKERAEPPDIDLDIQNGRREEVIQFVYDKYGRDRAAMVANVIRYRSKSAVREVGKALDLPEVEIDRLANLISYEQPVTPELLMAAGLDPHTQVNQLLIRLTAELLDFPRHLGIHPGGFLLGHGAVHELVPIENATMEGRTVIQWDKNDIEALELFKVDLLGLGMLTVVDESLRLLREHQDIDLSMATVPAFCEQTFEQIRAGDTVGVFQIESRAQMAMLPRLRPENWYDLVIQISIVRPGPISGGMVHPYLRRRNGEEDVTYPHPSLEPVLKKTLGIPLFQEQVMQLSIVAADYTPGEADQLRRDMAAWRVHGRLDRHRDRLISRMVQKGIKREFAERVFEQIRGFGEYGFPESHAASFALIAWASAWLKHHHPATFLCGLLNAQPMGFYSPSTLIEDAQRHDVAVFPIDVQRSEWDCTLERCPDSAEGFAVRMGLRWIKGFRTELGEKLLAARPRNGFASVEDLARRTGFERSILGRLAESGALGSLRGDRRDALWQARGLHRASDADLHLAERETDPKLESLDWLEEVDWDFRTTRHSTRGHPLAPLRLELSALGLPDARTLNAKPPNSRVQYAGMVINRQRPKTAGGVVFMTLEDETGFVNLVFWAQVFEEYSLLARTLSLMGVRGRLQSENGVQHLVVEQVFEPGLAEPFRRRQKSRDFH
jgi:error-prone DNA polymerase